MKVFLTPLNDNKILVTHLGDGYRLTAKRQIKKVRNDSSNHAVPAPLKTADPRKIALLLKDFKNFKERGLHEATDILRKVYGLSPLVCNDGSVRSEEKSVIHKSPNRS